MRRPVLALLLLASLTSFAGLGQPAITDSDEAYYAEAAREMVTGGDWLTPHFNFRQRWEKPVLYYWLTAATYAVAGTSEFTARFWSAVSGIGIVLLTWSLARASGASVRGGWLAGAIVATCLGYVSMTRVSLPDIPLACCVTLAVWAAFRAAGEPVRARAWWALAGVAVGLGLLMKGPVAVVVPGLVLLPIWWHERRTVHVAPGHLALAAALALIVSLPWYAAMTAAHGSAYLESFFVGDNFERFTTTRFNEPRPWWFYPAVVLGGLLPWTAYLVTAVVARARQAWRTGRGPETVWEWRLLCWAIVPLLFFGLSVGQQPRYVLPVLPPIAVLLAAGIDRRTMASDGRPEPGLAAATWATSGLLLLCAGLVLRLRPLFEPPIAVFVLTIAGLVAGAGVLAWTSTGRRWRLLPAVLVAAAVALLAASQALLRAPDPEAVERVAALVRLHRTDAEAIAPYRVFVRNLPFYTRIAQHELVDDTQARAFLSSPERVLLVARSDDLARLTKDLDTPVRTLGEVEYLDTADIRLRTLLARDPAAARIRVLLVSNR